MKLRAGQTLVSTMDATAVVVIRANADEVTITCGGIAMIDKADAATAPKTAGEHGQLDGTLLGKRYADEDLGLELLVTKPGTGSLAANGSALTVKGARPLPASD